MTTATYPSVLRLRIEKISDSGRPVSSRVCNFACIWCHGDYFDTTKIINVLTNEQLLYCVEQVMEAANLPIVDVRISGNGEPTLVSLDELCDLISRIRAIKKVRNIGVSTNGTRLTQYANPLITSGLDAFNVSLNSLDRTIFEKITKRNCLDNVLNGIEAAVRNKAKVKINVIYSALNINCIHKYIDLSARLGGVPVRFFDLLPTGNLDLDSLKMDLSVLTEQLSSMEGDVREVHQPYNYLVYRFENGAVVHVKNASSVNNCPNLSCNKRSVCKEGCRNSVRIRMDGVVFPCGVRTDNAVEISAKEDNIPALRSALRSGGKIE